MDGDDLIGLGVLLFFFPVVLVIAALWLMRLIAEFLWEYREEIAELLRLAAIAIWETHLAFGALAVQAVRDWPVKEFYLDVASDRAVRRAVVFWLTAAPVLLSIVGLTVLGAFWAVVFNSAALGFCLALPSVGAIIYGYYSYYFNGPITHYRQVRFVKEYYLMRAELQLAWLLYSTRAELWLLERTT